MLVKSMGYYSNGDAVRIPSAADAPVDVAGKRGTANRRSVWSDIRTESAHGGHYATFPPDLPRYCILASACVAGACGYCGAQYARVDGPPPEAYPDGWMPTCKCDGQYTVPATVLDPFAGSGTTCHVAQELGKRSIGIDVSREYLSLASGRLMSSTLPLDIRMFA